MRTFRREKISSYFCFTGNGYLLSFCKDLVLTTNKQSVSQKFFSDTWDVSVQKLYTNLANEETNCSYLYFPTSTEQVGEQYVGDIVTHAQYHHQLP